MLPEIFDLRGKIAIITGGASGIGRGIADGLAEAGANIVIASRRFEICEKACDEISKRTGVKSLAHSLDVTSKEEINSLVDDVIKEFGAIDILVNNAGVGGSEKPILKMNDDDWDHTLNTDLKGIFSLTQSVARTMVERAKGGKIINISSITAIIGMQNMSAYAASKSGVVQLTKVMALEWVRYNIQVNAILPGYFETPMNTEFFDGDIGKKVIKKNIPAGRLGQPEDMKGLAIYLASKASDFMTGSSLVIDGGQICW